jgi:hypothetical protein
LREVDKNLLKGLIHREIKDDSIRADEIMGTIKRYFIKMLSKKGLKLD